MAQVAMANDVAAAPTVGGTKVAHIEDAVAALEVSLNDQERFELGEPNEPPCDGSNRCRRA